ncbi:MAG: hypothetical protein LBE35_05715, partial [Clostridiales bacterium]|nr:hypothetical protein [Clostridiales bacterium]
QPKIERVAFFCFGFFVVSAIGHSYFRKGLTAMEICDRIGNQPTNQPTKTGRRASFCLFGVPLDFGGFFV